MEINTHESEVFVSTSEMPQVTIPACAAVGIGALLFGAGYLVGRLTGKPIPAPVHYHHHITGSQDDFDDYGGDIVESNTEDLE
jgi:hypothetical protein